MNIGVTRADILDLAVGNTFVMHLGRAPRAARVAVAIVPRQRAPFSLSLSLSRRRAVAAFNAPRQTDIKSGAFPAAVLSHARSDNPRAT